MDGTTLRKSIGVECLQPFECHEVGTCYSRAGVSCQFDTVKVRNAETTAIKSAKEFT
jgi:hypothetical protein